MVNWRFYGLNKGLNKKTIFDLMIEELVWGFGLGLLVLQENVNFQTGS